MQNSLKVILTVVSTGILVSSITQAQGSKSKNDGVSVQIIDTSGSHPVASQGESKTDTGTSVSTYSPPPPPPPPPLKHITVTDGVLSVKLFKGLKLVNDPAITGDDKNAVLSADGQTVSCFSGPVKNRKEVVNVSSCKFDLNMGYEGKPEFTGRFAQLLYKAIDEYSRSNFDDLVKVTTSSDGGQAEISSMGFEQLVQYVRPPNQDILCTKKNIPAPVQTSVAPRSSDSSKGTYKDGLYIAPVSSAVSSSVAASSPATPSAPPAPVEPQANYTCNLDKLFEVLDKTRADVAMDQIMRDPNFGDSIRSYVDKTTTIEGYKLLGTQVFQNVSGKTKAIQSFVMPHRADDSDKQDQQQFLVILAKPGKFASDLTVLHAYEGMPAQQ